MTWLIDGEELPPCLSKNNDAPKQLYIRAREKTTFDTLMRRPRVAIVGSRNFTEYGYQVTREFASGLAAHGVVIVSGLAIGIDTIAHQAALEAGGQTLAVLPSGTAMIYPRSNVNLARDILLQEGALVSEYPHTMPALKQNFVARNRIVSGLADALLIVEAAEHSGTSHTARFAMDQGLTVMAVPGNITSTTSVGTNNLLKQGAAPVSKVADVFHILGHAAPDDVRSKVRIRGGNDDEQGIIDLLEQGVHEGSKLHTMSGLSIEQFNYHLTMLEITAKVRPLGGNRWTLG